MARQQHAGQKGNPSGRSAFRTEGLPYIHVPSGRHHMRRRRPLSPTASDRGTSQPAQQGQPSVNQRLAPRAAKRPILPCETYGFESPNGLYWRPERPVCQQRANSRGSHRGKGGRKPAQLHGVTIRASGGQPGIHSHGPPQRLPCGHPQPTGWRGRRRRSTALGALAGKPGLVRLAERHAQAGGRTPIVEKLLQLSRIEHALELLVVAFLHVNHLLLRFKLTLYALKYLLVGLGRNPWQRPCGPTCGPRRARPNTSGIGARTRHGPRRPA